MRTNDIETALEQLDKAYFNSRETKEIQPNEAVYKTVNIDVLDIASKWPMVYVNPTPSNNRIVEAYRKNDVETIRSEFAQVTNELISEYILKKSDTVNPTWIFRGKQFGNYIYFYTMNFAVDRWLIDNVILPIIEEVTKDSSAPVRLNKASPIYIMLYELNRIDECDFDYLLPKLIDKKFEITEITDPNVEAVQQTSFDLLNVLISGEKPNRLLKYFKLGGKISNIYLESGNQVNYPPNISKVNSHAIESILWGLGINDCREIRPNDLMHGFSSYPSAIEKVKTWFSSYRLLHSGTTSALYEFNKNKLINKELQFAVLLLSIRCAKVQDLENICRDPEDANWYKVFAKYTDPSEYSINTSMISIENFEVVAAILHRNMFLLNQDHINDCLGLRNTLRHIFRDVLPILLPFKDSTSMLVVNWENVLNDINSKFIFDLYLNTTDDNIVEGLQKDILESIKKLYKGSIELKIEDPRFGQLPACSNDNSISR